MGQVERISVEVPAEVADALRESVGWGEHASVEEAARGALEDWQFERSLMMAIPDDVVRQLVAEADASGETIDGKEAMAEILASLEAFILERHGPGA